MKKFLKKAGWNAQDVDLWEINEAFAMVTMCPIDDFKLDAEKVNINGGACALGHPVGSTGSRIILTLIHALKRTGGKKVLQHFVLAVVKQQPLRLNLFN